MKAILDRILMLMKDKSWNKTDLAKAMNTSTASTSLMFSRKSVPSYETLMSLLSNYPEISAEWLFTGKGSMYVKNTLDYFDIPICGEVAAGVPSEITILPDIKYISISQEMISNPNDYVAFKVYGDSMSPIISHGDIILLHTYFDPMEMDGKVAAVKINQEVTLKRIWINHAARQTVLLPYNHHYQPIVLSEDSPDCLIIGYMISLIRFV